MKICITDSGLGGLSVCDALVKRLAEDGLSADICYFNASFSHELGYNYLGSQAVQIEMFDRVLQGIERYCAPDMILVACNTLSTLIDQTTFAQNGTTAVKGIIDAGMSLISRQVAVNTPISLFGTKTTIESMVYQQRLSEAGWQAENIAGVVCHGLPMAISCHDNVEQRIETACAQALPGSWYVLACTHFGVKAKLFNSDKILNPNDALVEEILPLFKTPGEIQLEMVARYDLDKTEVTNWRSLVTHSGVADMLADYQHIEDLF